MREIKFRAWDKRRGVILKVGAIDFDDTRVDPYPIPSEKPGETWPLDFTEVELMQYTGLKDKNGKEIYEGDILAYGGDNHNGVVIWDDDCGVPGFHVEEGARLRGDDKKKRIHGLPPDTEPMEVIGNIYENPRLARMWGRSFPKCH
jgi:uncharacterized phage protein (TIGR01671 family)